MNMNSMQEIANDLYFAVRSKADNETRKAIYEDQGKFLALLSRYVREEALTQKQANALWKIAGSM